MENANEVITKPHSCCNMLFGVYELLERISHSYVNKCGRNVTDAE